MSTVESPPITAEELLHMPDGDRYELVDGELQELDRGAISSWVGNQAAKRITVFVDDNHLGWVFGSDAGYCIYEDPNQVRRPDASFVARSRLEELPERYLRVAPDLVIEVVSPNDRYYEVERKVDEYLEAGVRMVWVINPELRTVRVFRKSESGPIDRHAGDELSGEDVLPGFTCRVAELFPAPS